MITGAAVTGAGEVLGTRRAGQADRGGDQAGQRDAIPPDELPGLPTCCMGMPDAPPLLASKRVCMAAAPWNR